MRAARILALLACTAAVAWAVPAAQAAPEPQPFGTNDSRGFRDVLPSGTNGLTNGPELAAFLANGTRPRHNDDQLRMYSDLVYSSPGLRPQDIGKFFKDTTFGVKPEDVERRYSPRGDVTIVRDRQFGVPHVYGDTRDGALFGLGYVAAEDRLFFIDVLRHLGRGELTPFAGGTQGNRDFEQDQWGVAPYTEADLQSQIDNLDDLYGAEGAEQQRLLSNYIDGINAYITEAKLNPLLMPGEYAAINRPQGPDPWKGTDLIATASLVGGIFGKGGGRELETAELLQSFRKRFGDRVGTRLWSDFMSYEDPEAPTTVHYDNRSRRRRARTRFTYEAVPKRIRSGSVALPDPGSVKRETFIAPGAPPRTSGEAILGLDSLPRATSNALVVSGRESASGHPLAVFGPQVAYFQPQILMEQEVHAPGWDARGAAFPGVNVIVQLGRGRDYSWSATSAGQDNIDTFAVDLCEPGGQAPTTASNHYVFRGACRPMRVLEKTNSWSPSAADQTPAGSHTLRAYRTDLGIVIARATIGGKPVAYTNLRSTYMHEADSARGFSDFNNAERMRNVEDFKRAAYKIGYTFNWLYVDDKDVGYFNSGNNPVRAPRTDPRLPVRASPATEWRSFDPERMTAAYTPPSQHPQVVNQSFMTSWNNKQARGYRAADSNLFSSIYRSQPLDDRVRSGIRGRRKMTLVQLIDAMEDAATVDLRADKVLPWALRVVGRPGDPDLAAVVAKLRAWKAKGAHRIDRDRNGVYEDSDAIRIMDAWWPRWLEAQFKPRLGADLYNRLKAFRTQDNDPNNHGDHLGSAYQDGWYGYAHKDLRAVLKRRVRGRYARRFCGDGRLALCRRALRDSLEEAARQRPSDVYKNDATCTAAGKPNDQWCWDAVRFRPLGGATQPLIHWVNRPTYQQVVEIQGHRPR